MKNETIRIVIIILAIIVVLICIAMVGGVFFIAQTYGREYNGLYSFLAAPGLGLMILFAIWSYIGKSEKDADRSEKLSLFAKQNSMSYQKTLDLAFLAQLDESLNDNTMMGYFTPLFATSTNVIMGKINHRNFVVSDQHYSNERYFRREGGSPGRTEYYDDTIVAIELPEANLPFFFLYPQKTYDSIANALGQFDINFPAHPNFSQRYVLRGNNEQHIRWLFDDRLLRYYEQPLPFTTTIGGGKYLLIYRNGLLSASEIMSQVQLLEQLARLFLKA